MGRTFDPQRHRVTLPNPGRQQTQIISGLGVDLPELRQARALWAANRYDESLALFEATARKFPQNLVALVDASRALGARFEIARAEAMLDRLVKLGGSRPELLHLAGQSYRMIFRTDQAIHCFERVLKLTKEPDSYLELAVLYERRHRVDEALRLVEECLRAVPDYHEARLFKARLLRRLKENQPSESLFRELSICATAHPFVRAQALVELAQTHDRREEYEAAMQAMLRCKKILQDHEGAMFQQADTTLAQLRNLVDSLSAAQFQRWRDALRDLPPKRSAVLTSFPRSGTTLLEQVLDSHSGAVSSDEREAFARDIFPAMWLTPNTPAPTAQAFDSVPVPRLASLRERYWSYMEAALNEPIGQRVHVDKNPTLMVVLSGFLRLLPESHVLVALRDPRDVVISCFMQYLPLNSNSVYFLTLERAARRYVNDLGFWLKLRDRIASPWLELRYEAAVADLEGEARRALEFLGLPWEAGVLNYRERLSQKSVSSPTYEAVSQPLYTRAIGRWKNYEKYLEPWLPILEPVVKALGY